MALTQAIPRLRSRGLRIDCCAWYPWYHTSECTHNQSLGFDSCAIFYIGGFVEVRLPWDFSDVDFLTAVRGTPQSRSDDKRLDEYEGTNCPGQPWSCYRRTAHRETDSMKNLSQHLKDLLEPETAVAELRSASDNRSNVYCPFLRLNQKALDKSEWLSKTGQVHHGAHFPLCVFTKNAGHRSEEADQRRNDKRRGRGSKGKGGKGDTAVAESKGKGGNGDTAVVGSKGQGEGQDGRNFRRSILL